MRIYGMIAMGGFIGAIMRFLLKGIDLIPWQTHLPLNTLFINLLGSLVLGFVLTTAQDVLKLDEAQRIGVVSGFLGAFTTFSAICKEVGQLTASGYYFSAALYIVLSVTLGLGSVWLGVILGSKVKALSKNAV